MKQHEHVFIVYFQHQIPAASKYQHNITTTSTLGWVEQWLCSKGNYYWRHPVFVYFHEYGRKGIYHDLSTSFLKVTFLIGWKCLKNLLLICLSTSHPLTWPLEHVICHKKNEGLYPLVVCVCLCLQNKGYIIYDDIWYTQNHNSTMDFGPHVSPILPPPLALAGFFWLTSAWRSGRIFFSLKGFTVGPTKMVKRHGDMEWHGLILYSLFFGGSNKFDGNSMFFSF